MALGYKEIMSIIENNYDIEGRMKKEDLFCNLTLERNYSNYHNIISIVTM